MNIIIPGATPKLTMSANESNCLPISELALRALAAKPSKKSRIAAKAIYMPAWVSSPFSAAIIDKQPKKRFKEVKALGI